MTDYRMQTSLGRCSRQWLWLLVMGCALSILSASAEAQMTAIPQPTYFAILPTFYSGNYTGALNGFQGSLRGGIQTPAGRWIDSICSYTMLGECYYHMGQLEEALKQYDQALTLFATHSNWMLSAQFPPAITPAGAGARAVVPWGASQRATLVGQFDKSYLVNQGQVNNLGVLQAGGVIQQAMMIPVSVTEIVRCTTLAIRRRHELMGPVCKYDPLTNQLITLLTRRPAPPNNWSQAWIDVELGTAYAAAGNLSAAVATLERSLVVNGEMDHPLTAAALLQLGLLALEAGDYARAGQLFQETTFAATTFSDPGLLEEAMRYGQLVHLITNGQDAYPVLAPGLVWARTHGLNYLHASLAILLAENLALQGETTAAVTALGEARNVLGRGAVSASAGDVGARFNMVLAMTSYQSGQVPAGDQAFNAAMTYQQSGSLWVFHIRLVDSLYLSGEIFDRVAAQLYEFLLRDPTALDWATSPLESLSVLSIAHTMSYEHWFEATLKRGKEPETGLEIADRTRRHRYLSSLRFGGRLLALRWVLEGPKELLNEQVLAQRQELLTKFSRYEQVAADVKKLSAQLAARPVVEESAPDRREQNQLLSELASLGAAQEVILREIAVSRQPAELVFPPLRKAKDLQQALPDGHAMLTFFETSGDNLHGFLFTRDKYTTWNVTAPALVRRHLSAMLREMGNTDHNHQLTWQDLGKSNWKKSAAKLVEALFDESNVDLSAKFDELIIVPDGSLWYLPFEALPIGENPQTAQPLISQVRVRYAPTMGLAIPYQHLVKPEPKPTGVVLGKLYPHDDETVARAAYEQLEGAVKRTVVLSYNPGANTAMLRTLLDGLIVLDDIEPVGQDYYGWSPMQIDNGKPSGAILGWMTLPWGGPEWVVLPGFHTHAEDGLRKASAESNDLFLAICGLMSTGVRTVLISRWRTGGQSSFDLVREFAQELPHSPPADCWQRAVQLLMSQQLDVESEPRLKKNTTGTDPPLADHPFFWAAYMLVDSGQLGSGQTPPPPPPVNAKPKEVPPAAGDVKGGGKVPPAGAGAAPPMADQPAPGAAPNQPANSKGGSKKNPPRSQRKGAKAPQDMPEN
jgi:tetratricopeptide (TPR) repeat protein